MAARIQSFNDLAGDFCKDAVVVRLINFWESRNFLKGNVLNGFELLLIDATKGDKEKQKKEPDEMGDAMKSLENRTLDSKREMDIIAALDEMKSMKVKRRE